MPLAYKERGIRPAFEGARTKTHTEVSPLRRFARDLYRGRTRNAQIFLYALLLFDLISLLLIIATSFMTRSGLVRGLDVAFGIAFLTEFVFRLAGTRRISREIFGLTTWTDLGVIASLLLSATSEAAGFLRALRTLTLLRTFRVVRILRQDSQLFR